MQTASPVARSHRHTEPLGVLLHQVVPPHRRRVLLRAEGDEQRVGVGEEQRRRTRRGTVADAAIVLPSCLPPT
jgi:hypothetical protein